MLYIIIGALIGLCLILMHENKQCRKLLDRMRTFQEISFACQQKSIQLKLKGCLKHPYGLNAVEFKSAKEVNDYQCSCEECVK